MQEEGVEEATVIKVKRSTKDMTDFLHGKCPSTVHILEKILEYTLSVQMKF